LSRLFISHSFSSSNCSHDNTKGCTSDFRYSCFFITIYKSI